MRIYRRRHARRLPYSLFASAAGLLALALYGLSFALHDARLYVLGLMMLSVVTFVAYRFDKWRAEQGGLRVPEGVLHALGALGGFIGGWLGMYYPTRHKSRPEHGLFRVILAASAVGHVAVLWWWFAR